jgi:hypothetical protein
MDRRAAIRAYKESRRPMGVYRIRNTATGRSVIGRSTDLPSRFNRDRAQLRFGMHPDRTLQREWNALGPDSFAFEILDTLEPPSDDPAYDPTEDLKVLEALWRERLDGSD